MGLFHLEDEQDREEQRRIAKFNEKVLTGTFIGVFLVLVGIGIVMVCGGLFR